MMKYGLMAMLWLCSFWIYAQSETIRPLAAASQKSVEKQLKRSVVATVFEIDTLELPFIDDFTRNRLKPFNLENHLGPVNVVLRPYFTINNTTPDRILFRNDTTYNLVYNTTTQQFDSIAQAADTVFFFESDTFYNQPTAIRIIWDYRFQIDSLGNLRIDSLLPDDDLINQFDSIAIAEDIPYYKWINQGAYHNYTFSNNPFTQGMITFDGTDVFGTPYDNVTAGTFGKADALISKPINLEGKQNVFLSFAYQSTGYGEDPDRTDSLTLRFRPSENTDWLWLWGDTGTTNDEWKEVIIQIPDTGLVNGFQLKFENYATLSGSFDHWHLDYIRLDDNRSLLDTAIEDVAFTGKVKSYLTDYYSVPYSHFKATAGNNVIGEQFFNLRNNSPGPKLVDCRYRVFNKITGNVVFTSNPINQPWPPSLPSSPNAPASDTFQVRHTGLSNLLFPATADSVMDYVVEQTYFTFPDEITENDTLRFTQKFDTYYAYDDGTAEQAYKIKSQANSRAAVRFESLIPDTIRALLINLPSVEVVVPNRRIKFLIWEDLNQTPIYESPIFNAPYTALNDFYRFPIEGGVAVSGTFFIGWQLIPSFDLWVGFDRNQYQPSTLFINTDGSWFASSAEGSLLFRPDFGRANFFPIGVAENQTNNDLQCFPNPNNGQFRINKSVSKQEIMLFNSAGQAVAFDLEENLISLLNPQPGIYFLRVVGAKTIETYKLVVNP